MAKIKIVIGERRVAKIGSSLYASLPCEWTEERGLRTKDGIEMNEGKIEYGTEE